MDSIKKIKIKPLLENEEDKTILKRPINPILPRIDKKQVILILGGIGVGKSTLTTNLIFSNDCYGYNDNSLFDIIYVISNTINNDKNAFAYRERSSDNGGCCVIFDKYEDSIISGIMDYQNKEEGKDQPFSLLVLEDATGSGTSNNNSKISEFVSKTRHYNTNIIIVGHTINQSFSSLIRANVRQIFLKKMRNGNEKKKFIIQYGDLFGGETAFNKMYDYTFGGDNSKYNFIYCNLDDLFCMKNFDEIMYKDEKLLI